LIEKKQQFLKQLEEFKHESSHAQSLETTNTNKSALKNFVLPVKADQPVIKTSTRKRSVSDYVIRTQEPVKKRRTSLSSITVDDFSDDAFDSRMYAFAAGCKDDDEADGQSYPEMFEIWNARDFRESSDIEFVGGFTLPSFIYDKLLPHQKQGIEWLWELHQQNVGGVIGDEMGLGKTIQVVAFLAGLNYTKEFQDRSTYASGPSLVICPASVLHQWLREFRKWYPPFRIVLLHDAANHAVSHAQVLKHAIETKSIVITTYATLRNLRNIILPNKWAYVFLDEGHQIKNPDAAITLTCKQLRTHHRILLTGSPIQNHLKELWSLFDFIFPGKLGTLPLFEEEFCTPILQGGYTHASAAQVERGFKCAVLLKNLISPHILRRTKADVKIDIPGKTERVLFCSLTSLQRALYQQYLSSKDVTSILTNSFESRNVAFKAISHLRKICNHPNLIIPLLRKMDQTSLKMRTTGLHEEEENFGADDSENDDYAEFANEDPSITLQKSGKLKVLHQILHVWKREGHRVLLFSQTRIMLNIIERYVESQDFSYLRMDGTTPIKSRAALMDEFNREKSIFIFLLTTRTGGLGVNLTGADRVIIFDPDWNRKSSISVSLTHL
jgi:DNA excision repair protein ERCC-6